MIKMLKNRKFWKRLFNTLFFLLLGYIVMVLVVDDLAFLNRYHQKVVVTDSMEPTIHVGDMVIIDESIEKTDLTVGDIIAFNTTINNQDVVVIHYIYSIDRDNSSLTFQTIAEEANTPDDWVLNESDIIGIYRGHVAFIGRIFLFAQSLIGRIVIALNIIGIYLIYKILLKDSTKKSKA